MVFRTALCAAWLLLMGLGAIGLEAQRIRIGHRIHGLLRHREALIERVRRLEARYNRMLSPDLLFRELPEAFRTPEEEAPAGAGG